MNTLSKIITPIEGFQYSVNIAYDIYDEKKIKSYIPSVGSLQIIEDVLASTDNRSTDRARILTGSYGKGKSHLILYILALLSGQKASLFSTAINKAEKENPCLAKNIQAYLSSGKKLLPVIVSSFTFVASDAHKLVRYKRFDAKTDGDQFALILPKKPSLLLKNILPKDDSELRLQFNEKMACFTFGNYKMVCTLVEGRFPNYNSVIPQNNPKKIIIEKKELYNSLRRVSVMANQASNLVKFDLSNGTIVISAQDVDYAMSGHETITCQYEGEEMAIGFKSPFVQEILSNLNTESLVLELSDPSRPGLFLPFESDNENEDLLMLLMPMMV